MEAPLTSNKYPEMDRAAYTIVLKVERALVATRQRCTDQCRAKTASATKVTTGGAYDWSCAVSISTKPTHTVYVDQCTDPAAYMEASNPPAAQLKNVQNEGGAESNV
jgi:hypothetical protein